MTAARPAEKILGLILARGGSTGVPGKNLRPIAGKPLIGHTIEVARASRFINRVIVATDSPEIASVARQFDVEVPLMRPSEISGKLSRAYDVYRYFLQQLAAQEHYRPDIVCMLFSTSYLKTVEDVDAAIGKLIETGGDWVFTVTECEHHPYRFFRPETGDRMTNFCGDVPSRDIWGNRQELPPVYRINGNAFVTWTENIENFTSYNIDGVEHANTDVRYVICPQDRSLDIDTELDFAIAEILLARRQP
jgi:CMP-N-acetylneuraminic acid synthetase